MSKPASRSGGPPRRVDTDERPFVLIRELTRACDLTCEHCRADAQPERHPETVARSDDELASTAVAEFEEATGASARPLSVHRLRRGMPAYDRNWSALDRISMPEGVSC